MTTNLASLKALLVARYDELKGQLSRRLGNPELASDALQETWLHLHAKEAASAEINAVHNPAAYLLRVASNLAVDEHRSVERFVSVGEIEAFADALVTDDPGRVPTPARIAESRETIQAMARLIEHMPARRREVFMAVRLEGLPQYEVAAQMGISLRVVERELQRAQEQIAQYVKRM